VSSAREGCGALRSAVIPHAELRLVLWRQPVAQERNNGLRRANDRGLRNGALGHGLEVTVF
jgi:hypothetical protein